MPALGWVKLKVPSHVEWPLAETKHAVRKVEQGLSIKTEETCIESPAVLERDGCWSVVAGNHRRGSRLTF